MAGSPRFKLYRNGRYEGCMWDLMDCAAMMGVWGRGC